MDGTPIPGPPRIDFDTAMEAVAAAGQPSIAIGARSTSRATGPGDRGRRRDGRAPRPARAAAGLGDRQAVAAGLRRRRPVRWTECAGTSGEIERQLSVGRPARSPLPGPVSNIASWNYPMSVQVHAELVQVLAGNAVVAKTPSQGGFHCLTLAHAFMRRAGLPVTLLSGVGARARRRAHPRRGASARWRSSAAAPTAARPPCRWPTPGAGTCSSRKGSTPGAIWDFTQWDAARRAPAQGLRVRQAALHRLPAVRRAAAAVRPRSWRPTCRWSRGVRFGHPLAVERRPTTRCPTSTSARSSTPPRPADLAERLDEALARRGPSRCTAGRSSDGAFLDGQDTLRLRRAGVRAGSRRRPGPCTMPSRSGRWTPSFSSTPRRSCWPR